MRSAPSFCPGRAVTCLDFMRRIALSLGCLPRQPSTWCHWFTCPSFHHRWTEQQTQGHHQAWFVERTEGQVLEAPIRRQKANSKRTSRGQRIIAEVGTWLMRGGSYFVEVRNYPTNAVNGHVINGVTKNIIQHQGTFHWKGTSARCFVIRLSLQQFQSVVSVLVQSHSA